VSGHHDALRGIGVESEERTETAALVGIEVMHCPSDDEAERRLDNHLASAELQPGLKVDSHERERRVG
jgi:hypothetical protein